MDNIKVIDLVQAMAKVEGFGSDPHNRPTRNNNPGDLEYHDWMVHKYRVLGSDGRFAIFANASEGYKAMADIVCGPSYRNLSVEQIIIRWNEGSQIKQASQSSVQYIKLVCQFTGLTPKEVPTKELADALISYNKLATQNLGIVHPDYRQVKEVVS